jgi:hypothetical protein
VVAYLLVSFSLSGFPSWAIENAWSMFNTIMISAIVAVFIGTMSLEAYYVSRTRKRIIEEFNKLSQSLSARK